jgi:hypothetical protein
MGLFLTDKEIATRLSESKPLSADWRIRAALKPKRGHREREFDVKGENGSQFRVILRQAVLNPLDFSAILALLVPKTNQDFRLLRCNGKATNIRIASKWSRFTTSTSTGRPNGNRRRVTRKMVTQRYTMNTPTSTERWRP